MSTDNSINLSQLQQLLIDGYACVNDQIDSGYMLVDKQLKVVFANQYCHKHFDISVDNQFIDCIQLFGKLNQNAVKLMNPNIYNANNVLEKNNKIIDQIFEIVIKKNTSIRFVFFVLCNNKFQSLLVNLIPYSDSSGKPIFIQCFFSHYDFWGHTNTRHLFDSTRSYKRDYVYLGSTAELPIKLSPRQEEIVFVLSNNVGLRQTAEFLKISYGTLTSTLKNAIYIKFCIDHNDISLLVEKAVALGYNLIIPQSLVDPEIIILDLRIRELYFND